MCGTSAGTLGVGCVLQPCLQHTLMLKCAHAFPGFVMESTHQPKCTCVWWWGVGGCVFGLSVLAHRGDWNLSTSHRSTKKLPLWLQGLQHQYWKGVSERAYGVPRTKSDSRRIRQPLHRWRSISNVKIRRLSEC